MSIGEDALKTLIDSIGLPKELVNKATAFIGELLANPLKELSNIIYDDIRYLRVKNQVVLLNKARDYFIDKQMSPEKVPVKILVPLLESCSLEEDLGLQKKWTALLINSALPENSVLPSYIDILKQLSPIEAKILDILFQNYYMATFSTKEAKYALGCYNIETDKIAIYLDNLSRLNLIKLALGDELLDKLKSERIANFYSDKNTVIMPSEIEWIDKDTFAFTSLGADFISSCKCV